MIGHSSLAYFALDKICEKFSIDVLFGKDFSLALLAVFFLIVPTITLAALGKEHKQQRKVASRIPLIAALLGVYLKENLYVVIFLAVSLMFNFTLIKKKSTEMLYQYRQFLWYCVFLLPTVILYYVGIFWEVSEFRFILLISFFIPYYFYSRYLNAFTFGEYFKKKLS